MSQRKQRRGSLLVAALVGLSALSAAFLTPAHAGGSAAPDLRQGAFCGQVVDAAGKPVAGATVAVLDHRNKVVAWTKTDAQGRYTVGAPMSLLDLPSPHHRGLLSTLGRGVVQVVSLPVKAVGAAASVVKTVDPVGTLKAVAVGAATGDAAPLAATAAGDMKGLVGSSEQSARARAAQAVVNGNPAPPAAPKKGEPSPGEVALLVSAPQCKEFRGPAGSYWMEGPAAQKSGDTGTRAWLDTVRLAPASGGKDSDTQDQAVHLSDPTADPALPTAGASIKVAVHVQLPAAPAVKVRVFAREQKTHRVAELIPQAGGLYAGTLTLDPKMSPGDTTLTICAVNAAPIGVHLSGDDGHDPMSALISGMDDLDADKPYHFDPRVTVSSNRLDLKMTVLDPSRETPAPAAPAPAAPAPAAGH